MNNSETRLGQVVGKSWESIGQVVGKCYYCGQDVHAIPRKYGAFTKRFNKKIQQYELADFWHSKCYIDYMNHYIGKEKKNELL